MIAGFDRLILGTASLGSKLDRKSSVKLIQQALEAGIRTFDTAPLYGACQSQAILEKAIQNRNDVKIYGKVFSKIHQPIREFAKLAYRRSGYRGMQSFADCLWLRHRLQATSKGDQLKADVARFISKQEIRYARLSFAGWFIHNPTNQDLHRLQRLFSGNNHLHWCGQNCADAVDNMQILQLHADFFSPQSTISNTKAKEIWVHGIHGTRNDQLIGTMTNRYKILLHSDPRICIVAGSTTEPTLQRVLDDFTKAI